MLSSLPELNECDPNPCLNGGTCVDGVQNYTCTCASFTKDSVVIYYTGRNCSTGQDYWDNSPYTADKLCHIFIILLLMHRGWQSSPTIYYCQPFKHDSDTPWQGYPELLCYWEPHPQHSLVQGWQSNCRPSGYWGCVFDPRSNPKWTRLLPV